MYAGEQIERGHVTTVEGVLGVDMLTYRFQGACDPVLAHFERLAELENGLLLPRNEVIKF